MSKTFYFSQRDDFVYNHLDVYDNPNLEKEKEGMPFPLEAILSAMNTSKKKIRCIEWVKTINGELTDFSVMFLTKEEL